MNSEDTARLKDRAALAGWIAALVLTAAIAWFFTQPLRDYALFNVVNQALQQSGDSRRLDAPVPSGALSPGVSRIGFWYTMTGMPAGTRVFVFAFIAGGTFFPCAAVVSPEGTVEEFIPLNSHARRMLAQTAPEIVRLYARRIVGAGP
ncbi:MAG: hypothetical protein FWC64_01495 [Treponema sp.]|nr:hypothetical protein [Treponema sp.]